eukprot:4432977-Amphidinium_carterae.1
MAGGAQITLQPRVLLRVTWNATSRPCADSAPAKPSFTTCREEHFQRIQRTVLEQSIHHLSVPTGIQHCEIRFDDEEFFSATSDVELPSADSCQ